MLIVTCNCGQKNRVVEIGKAAQCGRCHGPLPFDAADDTWESTLQAEAAANGPVVTVQPTTTDRALLEKIARLARSVGEPGSVDLTVGNGTWQYDSAAFLEDVVELLEGIALDDDDDDDDDDDEDEDDA